MTSNALAFTNSFTSPVGTVYSTLYVQYEAPRTSSTSLVRESKRHLLRTYKSKYLSNTGRTYLEYEVQKSRNVNKINRKRPRSGQTLLTGAGIQLFQGTHQIRAATRWLLVQIGFYMNLRRISAAGLACVPSHPPPLICRMMTHVMIKIELYQSFINAPMSACLRGSHLQEVLQWRNPNTVAHMTALWKVAAWPV